MTFTESRPYEWDAYFGRARAVKYGIERSGEELRAAALARADAQSRTEAVKRSGESTGCRVSSSSGRTRELADRAALRRARVESFFSVWGDK